MKRATWIGAVLIWTMALLVPYEAGAQDGCGCNGAPTFPEAAALLDGLGYPQDQYTVLLAWSERTRDGAGRFVTGFRMQPSYGGEPFDLYVGDTSSLLDGEALARLGIAPKKWDLHPVGADTEIPPTLAKRLPARPVPVGEAQGVPVSDFVAFPPLDPEEVLAQDRVQAEGGKKGARRIGAFRELIPPVLLEGTRATHGVWQPTPDGGRLWSLLIFSAGAEGIRVHLNALELPPSAQVTVYNGGSPSEAYGPYPGPAPGATDLWTATCFSDEVTVECYVPPGGDVGDVLLGIDRIAHVYVSFGDLQWAKTAGDCNLDVTCYPDWANTALAVGGIGSVGDDGVLWCTGTLIADLDPSTTKPLFLAANHCVASQPQASAIEVYWLYQTSTCDGTPPNPADVPRTTGGAYFLAGASETTGTDFSLLRLLNDPPGGVAYAGWSTDPPDLGDDVVTVHHPSGDFKRISFGTVNNLEDSFTEVVWDLGTTEPGSSGCPLFTASDQKIIGQLWGGTASCLAPDEPDFFGRFDKTYPLIESFLDTSSTPCSTPTAPTGVNATNGTVSGAVRVTWQSVPGALEYQVWRHTSPNSAEAAPLSNWMLGTLYEDMAAEAPAAVPPGCSAEPGEIAQYYYYFIKARNDCGESAFSQPASGYAGAAKNSGQPARAGLAGADLVGDMLIGTMALAVLLVSARRRRGRIEAS